MTHAHWILSLGALLVAGCVAPVTYNHPSKALAEKQKDAVECMAMANQAAVGAGNWSSDRAIRSAIFDNARDQYFAMCLESRGWVRGGTSSPRPSPLPTSAPEPVRDDRVFRQCGQAALVKLGLWDGPVDGENSPQWAEIWERYLDRHVETAHDHRQASIRVVLDRDLAASHQRINWATCTE